MLVNSRSVVEPFVDVTGFERSIASSRPGLLKEPVEKKKKGEGCKSKTG